MPPRSVVFLVEEVSPASEGFIEPLPETTFLIKEIRFHNDTANGVRARAEIGQSTAGGVYSRTGIRIVDQVVSQSAVLVLTDLYFVLTPRLNLVLQAASAELGVYVSGHVLEGVNPNSWGE